MMVARVAVMVQALSITYRSIDIDQFKALLNLADARPLSVSNGWTLEGDWLHFGSNSDNTPPKRTFDSKVTLEGEPCYRVATHRLLWRLTDSVCVWADMASVIRTLTKSS